MATTGHWYINPSGAKVDFTDPSADIDHTNDVTEVEIRKVTAVAGTWPQVTLWKGLGAAISDAEITAAIADQDDAAVPTLNDAPEAPSGQQAGVSDVAAVAAMTQAAITGGEAPTEVEFNALRVDLVNTRTTLEAVRSALNTVITRMETGGEIATT